MYVIEKGFDVKEVREFVRYYFHKNDNVPNVTKNDNLPNVTIDNITLHNVEHIIINGIDINGINCKKESVKNTTSSENNQEDIQFDFVANKVIVATLKFNLNNKCIFIGRKNNAITFQTK